MKFMKRFFWGFLIGLFFMMIVGGCCQRQYPTSGGVVKDSVKTVTKVVPRDTTILVPGSSIGTLIPLSFIFHAKSAKDIAKNAKARASSIVLRDIKKDRAHLQVKYIHDTIKVKCECDTAKIRAQILDSYTNTHREKTKIITPPPEKYVPIVTRILEWIGIVALLLVGVRFLFFRRV